MLAGSKDIFAIESNIYNYCRDMPSLIGNGYFLVHINNISYGIRKEDATSFGNPFDEISAIIANRGKHTVPFSTYPDAGSIAKSIRYALYEDREDYDEKLMFGFSENDFEKLVYGSDVMISDPDEAFDDGSFILHFDIGDEVRLIGFKTYEPYRYYDPATLTDLSLSAEAFYGILQHWCDDFKKEHSRYM